MHHPHQHGLLQPVGIDGVDQATIHLQGAEGEGVEPLQTGVAGALIIHDQGEAELLEGQQALPRTGVVIEVLVFGDLQHDLAGVQTMAFESVPEHPDQPLVVQLQRRHDERPGQTVVSAAAKAMSRRRPQWQAPPGSPAPLRGAAAQGVPPGAGAVPDRGGAGS